MARYIDADALDDTVQRLNEQGWQITRGDYKRIDSVLFEMPTADVKPVVRGEWIKESEYSVMGEGYMWYCSKCGRKEYFNFKDKKDNYCPNCGADMRTEDSGGFEEFEPGKFTYNEFDANP